MRTSHRCVIILTAAFFAFLSAAQTTTSAKSALSVAQAVSVRRQGELRWSPDGSRLVLTVTEPPKGADSQKHIWIFLPNSRELRLFTSSSKSESHPRWSPDGKQVAFLSDRDEFQQIYVMPADGGEAIRRTEGKRRIEAFEWSPDGKQIAFLAPQAKTEDEEKKEKDKEDARLVDRDDKRAH